MRRALILLSFVTFCAGFGFINPFFPDVAAGVSFTMSWDAETALPVSLTLLSNTTSNAWAIAAGIYDLHYVWTPLSTGSSDESYVMLLVDNNNNSSSSKSFAIRDQALVSQPSTSNTTEISPSSTDITVSNNTGSLLIQSAHFISQKASIPQAENSTCTNTTTNTSAKIRLAVSISIVISLILTFVALIAFEHGKRVALRNIPPSNSGESFRDEAELSRTNSNKGLELDERSMVEPVSAIERNDSKNIPLRKSLVKSIYEMA